MVNGQEGLNYLGICSAYEDTQIYRQLNSSSPVGMFTYAYLNDATLKCVVSFKVV